MIIQLKPVAAPRICGPCTLCCKVLAIPELEKPSNRWCQHAARPQGCRIYSERPESCREFQCLWLQGLAPDWARPDKVHGVLRPTTDGEHLILHEDPGYRGTARRLLREFLDRFTDDGKRFVVFVCGEERVF